MPRQKGKKVLPLDDEVFVGLPPLVRPTVNNTNNNNNSHNNNTNSHNNNNNNNNNHNNNNNSIAMGPLTDRKPSNDWDGVVSQLNVMKMTSKWLHLTSTRRQFEDKSQKGHQLKETEQFWENLNNALQGICSEGESETEAAADNGRRPSSTSYRNLPRSSNKALIIYFSRLASSKDSDDELDLDFVSSLVDNGANINTTDKYGQTVFHEVARAWHVDVAQFLLSLNADINKCDQYGRTPLHVAAAVNYPEMVKFLIENGASHTTRTYSEGQTAVHYAAKNDAVDSLRMLHKLNCDVEVKDTKCRTPVHVAAELDRSETALFLVEEGVSIGNCDASGLSTLTLMIDKMPPVAMKALDQFHTTDRANRKQYFYLNFMEPEEPGKEMGFTRTPMESVAIHNQMRLLLHPAFQRLITVKWKYFAKWAHWRATLFQFFFVLLWSVIGVLTPVDGTSEYTKHVFTSVAHRAVLEAVAVVVTLYLIFQELHEWRMSAHDHSAWQRWRSTELQQDFKFCHPRWPEEKKFIEQELIAVKEESIQYFSDMWNIVDWITYTAIAATVATRVCSLVGVAAAHAVYRRLLAISIIIIWVRLMKFMRPFSSLGPFVVMLANILLATLKFSVLYLGVFVPYLLALWINFGGVEMGRRMEAKQQSKHGWEEPQNLIYSTWLMTVVGDFDFEALHSIDPVFAQILVGTFTAISSIVLLNLYIALLSDTFQRVHDNVHANALMQKVIAINSYQSSLSKKKRDRFLRYIQGLCAPEKVYYDDDDSEETGELEKMTIQIKEVVDEIKEAIDTEGVLEHRGEDNNSNASNNNNKRNNRGNNTKSIKYISGDKSDNQASVAAVGALKEELQVAMGKHMREMESLHSKLDHITNLLQNIHMVNPVSLHQEADTPDGSVLESEASTRLDLLPSIYDLKPELFSADGSIENGFGRRLRKKKKQHSRAEK